MEAIYNYLLQSGLCMLLLYLFYSVVLRHFPRPGYNRVFLLLVPVVALLIPVADFQLPFFKTYSFAQALPSFELKAVTVNGYLPEAEASINNYLNIEFILAGLYTLVAFVLLVKLSVQLFRLRNIIRTAIPSVDYTSGATILQTSSDYSVFAFLNYVFVSPHPHLTDQEQQQVLAHELAHVRLRHTYDVLYYELLTIILWFNPLVWLLKAELRDVHEYQADAEVISAYKPEIYTSLLAKQALFKTGIPVGSYFYKPQVFKRLHMLQQYGRKTSMLRPLLALPLLLFMLFLFSAEGVTAEKVAASLTNTASKTPSDSTPATGRKQEISSAIEKEPAPVTELSEEKATEPIPTAEKEITPAPENMLEVQGTQQKEKPYTYVDQMPHFESGDEALMQFVASNVRYPKEAQQAKTEGLVVISFVVEKNGSLTEPQVIKGLGNGTDEEALRVINLTNGKWQPGRQNGKAVPVRYTFPLRFQMK